MTLQFGNGFLIADYGKINILVGKNGCGKSTLLRAFDQARRAGESYVKYVTPERGGSLQLDGGIETNSARKDYWLEDARRQNQFPQFRQASVSEFRRLETLVLRKIEKSELRQDLSFTFDTHVAKVNALLDRIEIFRLEEGGAFGIRTKGTAEHQEAYNISSGEAELISLAIEILSFSLICEQPKYANRDNWLLLDEPDVHLHPDLQCRLMMLLREAVRNVPCKVLISTHSTPILASLGDEPDSHIAFMTTGMTQIAFRNISDALKKVLPVFGAHPLSNVFNNLPILLVEGEDDERIWQTAVRSSQDRIRLYPCVAGNIQSINEHEMMASSIINSVYEGARAYSIRDRDDDPYEIQDLGPVIRARLNCRASENLLLTDDVLQSLGTDWPTMRHAIAEWADDNPHHAQAGDANHLRNSNWNRRDTDVKALRNVLMMLAQTNKQWEVVVGRAIASLMERPDEGEYSLRDFLGQKIVTALSLQAPMAAADIP